MLTIRLQRRGRTNDPSFRVIVVDSKRSPKTGSYVELVGSYDPRTDRIDLKEERIKHWLSQGAKTSDTVHNLLITKNIIEGKKINILPRYVAPAAAEGGEASVGEAPSEPVSSDPEEATRSEEGASPQASEDNPVAQEEAAQ